MSENQPDDLAVIEAALREVPLTWSDCHDPTHHTHTQAPRDPDYPAMARAALTALARVRRAQEGAGKSEDIAEDFFCRQVDRTAIDTRPMMKGYLTSLLDSSLEAEYQHGHRDGWDAAMQARVREREGAPQKCHEHDRAMIFCQECFYEYKDVPMPGRPAECDYCVDGIVSGLAPGSVVPCPKCRPAEGEK